jgi:cytochrome P450
MDEDIYDNPEQFQPRRFMNHSLENSAIKLDRSFEKTAPTSPTKEKERFTKNGAPVKHNLLPFGGGVSLVSVILTPVT